MFVFYYYYNINNVIIIIIRFFIVFNVFGWFWFQFCRWNSNPRFIVVIWPQIIWPLRIRMIYMSFFPLLANVLVRFFCLFGPSGFSHLNLSILWFARSNYNNSTSSAFGPSRCNCFSCVSFLIFVPSNFEMRIFSLVVWFLLLVVLLFATWSKLNKNGVDLFAWMSLLQIHYQLKHWSSLKINTSSARTTNCYISYVIMQQKKAENQIITCYTYTSIYIRYVYHTLRNHPERSKARSPLN